MKKRLCMFVTILLLALNMNVLFVSASSYSGNRLFVDDVYLLDDSTAEELNEKLVELSNKHKCEILIHTTDDMEGKSATQYADDFFDYNGYGYGEDYSGILLMIDVEGREWAISTTGFGIDAFTDAGQEYMMDQILDYLSNDEWEEAFFLYADLCDELLTQAYTGQPYDIGHMPAKEKSFNLLIDIPIGLLIGFLIALIAVSIDRAALKTVRSQALASDYVKQGSFQLTGRWDQFLYRHVDRIEKEEGGSSTHRGSSGRSHGGSSGRF